MKPMNAWRWIVAALACGILCPAGAVKSHAFDQAHTRFSKVLADHVVADGVNYGRLKANDAELQAYLDEMAEVTEKEFDAWERPRQLAFLLNLYNAATLALIIDHYPVTSIRSIGGWARSPWKLEIVRLWGDRITLDRLEHGIIRPQYAEPRIHFALVCAAKGCPPLRREAFVGDRLDDQLDDQVRAFLAQKEKNRVDIDAGRLHLSPIFDWYRDDFLTEVESLPDYVRPYFDEAAARILTKPDLRVEFTKYDWSLNDVAGEE